MDGQLAEMIFSDPPYNLQIPGFVSGKGAADHDNFVMATGEMSSPEFTRFLQTSFTIMAAHCIDGAIAFICMDHRHLQEILTAGRNAFTEFKNLIVWTKNNAGMGTFYRSQHELIFAFKKGAAPHINNFELGQHGRSRSNVWAYRGNSSFKPGRLDELALHPTTKPVEMIADAIKDVSRRGGIVLDVFGGSGSTLIAAHKTGRRGFLAELEPKYVDRTIRRWETYAHDDAILISTGQRFEELVRERATTVDAVAPRAAERGGNRRARRGGQRA
jgi:DNA modification methylase